MVTVKKAPADEPVGISAKLRQTHPWFEALTQKIKDIAIAHRQKALRTKGVLLTAKRLVELSDELEEIQRQINPLENRRKAIVERLLVHWAHTGIEEVEGALGKTLISLSFELGVDPKILRETVDDGVWQRITERMLQPSRLLAEGRQVMAVRAAVAQAATVRKLKVSVIPPSSRRSKSGAADTDDEIEDAP